MSSSAVNAGSAKAVHAAVHHEVADERDGEVASFGLVGHRISFQSARGFR